MLLVWVPCTVSEVKHETRDGFWMLTVVEDGMPPNRYELEYRKGRRIAWIVWCSGVGEMFVDKDVSAQKPNL